MIGSCSSIDLQVNRKGGPLVIGWAYDEYIRYLFILRTVAHPII